MTQAPRSTIPPRDNITGLSHRNTVLKAATQVLDFRLGKGPEDVICEQLKEKRSTNLFVLLLLLVHPLTPIKYCNILIHLTREE